MDGHVLMNRRYRALAVTGVLASTAFIAALIASGCGSTDCSFTATCGNGTAPPTEGGADVIDGGGADAPVDPCVNTPTDPKCLDENTALFVSAPNGVDATATGTQAKPFKTIGAALGKITAAKRRIYVCDGTYAEDLALNTSHSGVSLFGGIDCTFKAVSTNKPVVGASANPVKIDGTMGLAIADIAVQAKDATTGSSIGIFASGSDVTLSRVRVTAGAGGKGDTGTRTDYTLNSTLTGNDGSTGGAAKTVMCPAGDTTTGGKGGPNGFDGDPGTPGTDNKGTVSGCSMSNTGGANGVVGTTPPAATGAVVLGNLKSTGWLPEPGSDGASGGAGQGGGGGAGLGGGTGGGGGAGGCGGKGGGGGNGGGASVAIASYQTTLRLINAVLVAKDAGAGGAGATGQGGQSPGGSGGAKTSATPSCQGGNGAAGGSGAPGGGGAGGISVGLLFKGSAPIADDGTKQAIIVGNKGGPGAAVGQMSGVDGIAQPLLDLK
jgi:hypothetical protein